MSTTSRFVVPVLLLLTACSGAPRSLPRPPSRLRPAAASSPAVVYQAQGTIWVRPSGSASVVDVGNGHRRDAGAPRLVSGREPTGRRGGLRGDLDVRAPTARTLRRLYARARGRASTSRRRLGHRTGEEIAFVEVQTEDGETTSRALLRVLDVADGHVRNILAGRTGRVGFYSPRWSDDGDSLVLEEDVFASTLPGRDRGEADAGRNGPRRRSPSPRVGELAWDRSSGPGSPTPDWSAHRGGLRPRRQPGAGGPPERQQAAPDDVRRRRRARDPADVRSGRPLGRCSPTSTGSFGVDDEGRGCGRGRTRRAG